MLATTEEAHDLHHYERRIRRIKEVLFDPNKVEFPATQGGVPARPLPPAEEIAETPPPLGDEHLVPEPLADAPENEPPPLRPWPPYARVQPSDARTAEEVEGEYFGDRYVKRQKRTTRPIGIDPVVWSSFGPTVRLECIAEHERKYVQPFLEASVVPSDTLEGGDSFCRPCCLRGAFFASGQAETHQTVP